MKDRIEIYLVSTGVEYTLPMTPDAFDAARAALAEIQGYATPLEHRNGRWMFVMLTPEEQAAFGRFLAKRQSPENSKTLRDGAI